MDPTGHGVGDAINKVIRITAPFDAAKSEMFDRWMAGNPSKLVRFFHMRNKQYVGEANTKAFVLDRCVSKSSLLLQDNSCSYVAQKIPKAVVASESPQVLQALSSLPWK